MIVPTVSHDATEPAVASCDRCESSNPGERNVVCYFGCAHWQCEDCARATESERLGA